MDAALAQWFASLGVGGVLAGGMFAIYRRDCRETSLDRVRMVSVIERHAIATERLANLLASHHDTEVSALTRLEDSSRQIGHDVKNVLARQAVP